MPVQDLQPHLESPDLEKEQLHAAMQQQKDTPQWVDALASLALAGVGLFNGFQTHWSLRVLALIALFIMVIVQNRYSASGQMKSNAYLVALMASVLCGFLAAGIVVMVSLWFVYPIPLWYPWVLLGLTTILVFLALRAIRNYFFQNSGK